MSQICAHCSRKVDPEEGLCYECEKLWEEVKTHQMTMLRELQEEPRYERHEERD